MKIAVIGGASSYSPELVDGLFSRLDQIPVTEVWMMDPNQERLAITSGLAQRMSDKHGTPFAVHATGDMREAVKDAKYVVTQLRVGGIQARINDEKLGLKHGIVGQETTGVGGFACALRTIPPILDIAHAMEELASDGYLINFTNPSGIVTEALLKHSSITSVGLCNVPICMIMDIVKHTGCAMEDVELDYVGLNHLSWVRGLKIAGADQTQTMLDTFMEHAAEEWEQEAVREEMLEAMRSLKVLPNGYLQYYYATDAVLDHLKTKEKTRGEEVVGIEATLFDKYQQPELNEKPAELSERGGAHYSTAAFHLISAIENDTQNRQIVCCRNNGAVPTFDDDASVELSAIIGRKGATAIPQETPAPAIRGLMQLVKAYETMTVQAAVSGDRETAFQAMLMHPLMPDARGSRAVLDELLDINKSHLQGTFF
ncbi:MAG: 6-phospho-beta-glucosidase [bacterium]|nr:6-phospho-beta-glucosidase [bacterium]